MNTKRVLLDVRSPEEFLEYSIQGSIHVPVQEILSCKDVVALLAGFDISRDSYIILYCASGVRASVAENVLKQHGFSNVENKKSIHAIENK